MTSVNPTDNDLKGESDEMRCHFSYFCDLVFYQFKNIVVKSKSNSIL